VAFLFLHIMNTDDFFYLGKVTKAVGYKGEVAIYLDVDVPSDYYDLSSVLVKTNTGLIPYFFEKFQFRKDQHFRALFQGFKNEEDTRAVLNKELYLPLEVLPKLSGNKFYYHEIIGFKVSDKTHGVLGKVTRIIDLPANPLLEVLSDNGIEMLVPMNDEVIVKVNRTESIIEVELPEGLFELYHFT